MKMSTILNKTRIIYLICVSILILTSCEPEDDDIQTPETEVVENEAEEEIETSEPSSDTITEELDTNTEVTLLANFDFIIIDEGIDYITVEFNNTTELTHTPVVGSEWRYYGNWDYGNGVSSSDENPTYTYPKSESGTVSYTVTLSTYYETILGVLAEDMASSTVIVKGIEQEPLITDGFDLINTGEDDDPVTISEFSSEESVKTNYASNILDKDIYTKWTSNDEYTGDNKGDEEFIIFDLGTERELGLIQISTDGRQNPNGYQILTSTTGITDDDFSMLIPENGSSDDLAFTETSTTDLQPVLLSVPTNARYVKLIGYGRFDVNDTAIQTSYWNQYTEIEFWSTKE